MSKICVILVNYNDSRFIINWMKRFEHQWPDEVIFVDDHSTDNSLRLVSHLQDQYHPLRVIQNEEKKGCFGGVMTACKYTDAEFISVWSCDDDANPGYMKQMNSAIDKYPLVDLFSCNAKVIREGSHYYRTLFPFDSYVSPDYMVRLCAAGYAKNFNVIGNVVRRNLVQKLWDNGGKDMNVNFDALYCYFAIMSKGVVNLGDYLVTYRSYANGFGASGKLKDVEDSIAIGKAMYSYYPEVYQRIISSGIWSDKSKILSQLALHGIKFIPKALREAFYRWLYSYDYRIEKL